MSTIDQQFVEYIVKSLVGVPEDVVVERKVDEKGVLLTLTVNPEDLGRVIGRRGVTAQSLRTLLRALGTKNSARYNLKIVNNDNPEETVEYSSDDVVENSTPDSVEKDESKESTFAKKSRQELAELDDLAQNRDHHREYSRLQRVQNVQDVSLPYLQEGISKSLSNELLLWRENDSHRQLQIENHLPSRQEERKEKR